VGQGEGWEDDFCPWKVRAGLPELCSDLIKGAGEGGARCGTHETNEGSEAKTGLTMEGF